MPHASHPTTVSTSTTTATPTTTSAAPKANSTEASHSLPRTVEDLVEAFLYAHPPPAVRAAVSASPSLHRGAAAKGDAPTATLPATGAQDAHGSRLTYAANPDDDDDERRALGHVWLAAAALRGYSVHIAAEVYRTTGLTVSPSVIASIAARVFLPAAPTSGSENARADTTTTSSGPYTRHTTSAHTLNTNDKGEKLAQHWREVVSTLGEKHAWWWRNRRGKRPRDATSDAATTNATAHEVPATGEDRYHGSSTRGGGAHEGSGGGTTPAASRAGPVAKTAPPLVALQGGDAAAADETQDDPTSPRRPHAPSRLTPNASQSGGNGGRTTATPTIPAAAAAPSMPAAATAGVGGGSGSGSPREGLSASVAINVDSTQSATTASSQEMAVSSPAEEGDPVGHGSLRRPPLPSVAGNAADDSTEEDVTPVDRLWRSIPLHTAEQRRQLYVLRYETALTPEILFFIIQSYFFLVPGADVFLAPVPPNTIMEYNEVKSNSYSSIIYAPLSLMDVKVAVRESRRLFHHQYAQQQQLQERHQPTSGARTNPPSHPPLSPTSSSSSLSLALTGSDSRVLTIADLERSVWHIASNCSMFNAPEGFYPRTGRSFALGCTEALVRYCADQLLHPQP